MHVSHQLTTLVLMVKLNQFGQNSVLDALLIVHDLLEYNYIAHCFEAVTNGHNATMSSLLAARL